MTALGRIYDLLDKMRDRQTARQILRSFNSNATWTQMVETFHRFYALPTRSIANPPDKFISHMTDDRLAFRAELIREEVSELQTAIVERDIIEIADGIADIIYVLIGTALEIGLDIDMIFKEVHASNMTKMGENEEPIFREDGKLLKGPNFIPPQLNKIIQLKWEPPK